MTERAYTVPEIDRMRSAVRSLLLIEIMGMNNCYQRPPNFEAQIENRLRTYLVAGSEPEDLLTYAAEQCAIWHAERKKIS